MLKKIFYKEHTSHKWDDELGNVVPYSYYELKEAFELPLLILKILLFVVLISGGLILLLYALPMSLACNQLADLNPAFDFDWTFLNGCLVRTEGMDIWIPVGNIRTLIQ